MHKRLILVILIGVFAAGCARGPATYRLTGTVTYRGQPLPKGVIYFDPDPTRANTGPQGYAMIHDGKYDTAEELGHGVVGGAYIARIEGFDGNPGEELPLGKLLFADFRQAIDLPLEGPAEQDFQIP